MRGAGLWLAGAGGESKEGRHLRSGPGTAVMGPRRCVSPELHSRGTRPKVGLELVRGGEALDILDRGGEGGGGHVPHAGNGAQGLDALIMGGDALQRGPDVLGALHPNTDGAHGLGHLGAVHLVAEVSHLGRPIALLALVGRVEEVVP